MQSLQDLLVAILKYRHIHPILDQRLDRKLQRPRHQCSSRDTGIITRCE